MEAAEEAGDAEERERHDYFLPSFQPTVQVRELLFPPAGRLQARWGRTKELAEARVDYFRGVHVLWFLQPEEVRERRACHVRDGGDLKRRYRKPVNDSSNNLRHEPERLHERDCLGETVVLREVFDGIGRLGDQPQPIAFDDRFQVFHLQDAGTGPLGADDEAAHVVVEGVDELPAVPVARVVLVAFVQVVEFAEDDECFEKLGHCDAGAEFGGEHGGCHPA